MMKGNNELVLNQATMIEAIQMYLDSQMVEPAPKVNSIYADSQGTSETFHIALCSPPSP